jgi:hypothetical protein
VSVPSAFDASGNATTFTFSSSLAARSSRSSVVSFRIAAMRTSRPRSYASSSHGETFASWSSSVTTTASPAFHVRAAARVSAKFSVVMFAPKIVSSGAQPRNSAAVSRA